MSLALLVILRDIYSREIVMLLSFTSKNLLLLFVSLMLSACASTHKSFHLAAYNYENEHEPVDSIHISYLKNLQYISDNRWYSKKEKKWKMIAVAVKVENRTSSPVVLTEEDLMIVVHDQPRRFLRTDEYAVQIKQRVGRHMLHTLYGPWTVSWDDSGDVDVLFLPVGLFVGIGNAIRADKANKANAADLERLKIWNRVINPGETKYGVVLVSASPYESLKFALRK